VRGRRRPGKPTKAKCFYRLIKILWETGKRSEGRAQSEGEVTPFRKLRSFLGKKSNGIGPRLKRGIMWEGIPGEGEKNPMFEEKILVLGAGTKHHRNLSRKMGQLRALGKAEPGDIPVRKWVHRDEGFVSFKMDLEQARKKRNLKET